MKSSVNDVNVAELFEFAIETIKTMGQEALKYYGKKSRPQTPFNQDLVTQAELHLIESFQNQMKGRYPDHGIYGQDHLGEGYTHDAKRYLWVFDPLDGVDNFQSGIPVWGMSLALYENYWPVCGLFYMPATGDLFRAMAGEKAYWNDNPIHNTDRNSDSQESLLLTFSRFHQHYECRFPGKIRDFGSIGAHACYVAMGRADAALTARESFKDLAAVRVIVESAGGKVFTADGSEFYLGDYIEGQRIEQHLLITRPSNTKLVRDAIKRIR
jgi:myo-inositol-1(or 4)-monophosphatase